MAESLRDDIRMIAEGVVSLGVLFIVVVTTATDVVLRAVDVFVR